MRKNTCTVVMNVSVAMTYGNVTEELLNSTTYSDALVIIVNSSPSWHLSVGIGISFFSLLLTIISSVIAMIKSKWVFEARNANHHHDDVPPISIKRIDSDDSGAFTVSICSEGEIETQTVHQKEESSSTDSFFSIDGDSDSL